MNSVKSLTDIRARLEIWFATQLPGAVDIEVSDLVMPDAGTSNETFFLTLRYLEGGVKVSQALVIRWPPKGFLVFPEHTYDMARQYRLLKQLNDQDVPTPQVYWLELDASVIGMPFYIMARADGWVPGDFPPYHAAGKLYDADADFQRDIWLGGVETMANIHAVDWRAAQLAFLGVPNAKEYMEWQVSYYDDVLALNHDPTPEILLKTREWLLIHRFAPKTLSLCWGDARLGNMVFNGNRVAAALDWEMAHVGDPDADLAWYCHVDWAASLGRPQPLTRLVGLPDTQHTIASYEKLSGRKVENFDYYDVFAAWRLAIVYTRVENDEKYLARSGNAKGFLTATHFNKLNRLIKSLNR